MKITCDKCGASYKIPEEKLTRDVSKATCKKCGEKIIIRKPGANDAYEDPRLTGGLHASGDDDGMVDHNEERTVIAQVPELQKFDATPPLAVTSTTTVPTLPEPRRDGAGTSTASMTAPKAPEAVARAVPAPTPARAPEPVLPVVTSQPVQPTATQSALPTQSTAPLAAPGSTTTRKPTAKKAATWLAVGPLVLAVIGLLLYIPQGLWGMANYQAVGFMLALFGSLAAIVLQAELIRTGSLNMALGFLLPALGVVGLGGSLLSIQEVPFLTEGVKESLDLIIATAAQPEAPDAKPMSLAERVRQKKANKPKPRLNLPSGDVPVALNGGVDPAANGGQPGLKDPGAAAEVQAGGEIGTSGGTLPLPNMRRGPQSDIGKGVAQVVIDWDHEKMDSQLEGTRVRKLCYSTALKGMAPPRVLRFRMLVTPEGKVTQAQVTEPEEFKQSSLADCMIEKVKGMSWPSHNSTKSEWYDKSFH